MTDRKLFPRPAVHEFVLLVIGLVLTAHYAWLLDDAFVYFRYIDNFLFMRVGLVYNAGEYVEGYSSPLWCLLLTLLRLTELHFVAIVRLLGAAFFVVAWWLLVLLERRAGGGRDAWNIPACILCVNYAVLSYFTSGVETPLVQIAAILFALAAFGPPQRWLDVTLGLAPLLRPELLLPFGVFALWRWWRDGRFPWVLTFAGALPMLVWLVFRVWYYADLLPNTFYLKDEVDIRQGLAYIHDTLIAYSGYGFILAGGLLLVLRARSPYFTPWRGYPRALLVACAVIVALYVVKIGGDPRHYRYLAFSIPLLVCTLAGVGSELVRQLTTDQSRRVVVIGSLALAVLSFIGYPRQLSSHPIGYQERHRQVAKINDASIHRHDAELNYVNWGRVVQLSTLRKIRRSELPSKYVRTFAHYRCVRGYVRLNERMIHSLGLTDPFLARTVMRSKRPAHKWGLGRLAKDMVRMMAEFGPPARGMYRRALDAGKAPDWVKKNIDTIELIEKKVYNQHSLRENIQLALSRPGRIVP